MIQFAKSMSMKKRIAAVVVAAMTMAIMSVMAVASTAPQIGVTTAMLTPILDAIIANIAVILPVGIGIFAIMIGVRLIPRIFGWFTRS